MCTAGRKVYCVARYIMIPNKTQALFWRKTGRMDAEWPLAVSALLIPIFRVWLKEHLL